MTFSVMQAEFDKALKKLEKGYEEGKVDKSDFDKLHIWHEFLKAKVDAERVVDAVINAMAKDAERLLSPAEISALDAVIVEVREILAKSEKSSEIIAATEYLAKASDDFASKRMDDSVHKALAGSSIDELGLEEKGLEANSHS